MTIPIPMLPCKIIVEGTPSTIQTKNKTRLNEWKEKVKKAAVNAVKAKGYPSVITDDVEINIYYYYDSILGRDTDNIIKYIQDPLIGIVYDDDRQIKKVVAESRDLNYSFDLRNASSKILNQIAKKDEFVSINVLEYLISPKLV